MLKSSVCSRSVRWWLIMTENSLLRTISICSELTRLNGFIIPHASVARIHVQRRMIFLFSLSATTPFRGAYLGFHWCTSHYVKRGQHIMFKLRYFSPWREKEIRLKKCAHLQWQNHSNRCLLLACPSKSCNSECCRAWSWHYILLHYSPVHA